MLRDIYTYARRHPMKVFMLVIMPLITGGALTKILATIGVRLPAGLAALAGGRAGGGGGGGFGDIAGAMSGAGGMQSAMNIAKMFM